MDFSFKKTIEIQLVIGGKFVDIVYDTLSQLQILKMLVKSRAELHKLHGIVLYQSNGNEFLDSREKNRSTP